MIHEQVSVQQGDISRGESAAGIPAWAVPESRERWAELAGPSVENGSSSMEQVQSTVNVFGNKQILPGAVFVLSPRQQSRSVCLFSVPALPALQGHGGTGTFPSCLGVKAGFQPLDKSPGLSQG